MVLPVKVPPILVLAVAGDLLHAVSFWMDDYAAATCAADTFRYVVRAGSKRKHLNLALGTKLSTDPDKYMSEVCF